jgi:hypothetical protein
MGIAAGIEESWKVSKERKPRCKRKKQSLDLVFQIICY